MKLIVGLGNVGKEYHKTRHNVGFMVIDALAEQLEVSFNKEKMGGLYAEVNADNEKIILLKPQKYINLSGDVIFNYLQYFKIKKEDMLIINDDLDLEIGKYKLREQGGSAGHNGLKNIEANLQSDVYNRLKIGISNNKNIETRDYVLSKFTDEEMQQLNVAIETCTKIAKGFIKNNMLDLMNEYNKK